MKLLKHKVYSQLKNGKIWKKTKNTKMPRFNIYRQLQVIVDSFSFDCYPQFKFLVKHSYTVMLVPGNMLYTKCFSFTSAHI